MQSDCTKNTCFVLRQISPPQKLIDNLSVSQTHCWRLPQPCFSVTTSGWQKNIWHQNCIQLPFASIYQNTLGPWETLLINGLKLPLDFIQLPALQRNTIIVNLSGSERWMSMTLVEIYIGLVPEHSFVLMACAWFFPW